MWSQPPPIRLGRGTAGVLLASILLAAFGVRAWYAAYRLDGGRFWDERYAQANVRSIVDTGSLRPVSIYYPSPVFNLPAAAAAVVAERLTGESLFDPHDSWRLTRNGYLVLRLLQATFGVAAVAVLFVLARRLFGPGAGLFAALAVAFQPWHIRLSGYFKPDALLSLTVLLVLYASIRLLERPGWRWSVATGLAIAAAMGSKLTGAVAALPLACTSLLGLRRVPRRIAWTAMAAAVAGLAFIVSNPYWRAYPSWLDSLKADYARRASWHGMQASDYPRLTLDFLTDPFTLGRVGTVAALLGLVLALLAALHTRDAARRAQLLIVALFPIVWVVALATQTPYFKGNNLMPILPVLALLGVAALSGAWRALGRRSAILRRPAAGWSAGALLALALVRPGMSYVYRSLTPSTFDAAYASLGGTRDVGMGRLAWAEAGALTAPPMWEGSLIRRHTLGVASLPEDAAISSRRLDLADAVIVRARGAMASTLPERYSGSRSHRVSSRPFLRRGPTLLVVRRPWRRYAEPVQLELRAGAAGSRVALLRAPPGVHGLHGSLTLWFPTRPHAPLQRPRVSLGGERYPIYEAAVRADGRLFVGERIPLARRRLRLRIRDARFPRRVAARLHLWLPPRPSPRPVNDASAGARPGVPGAIRLTLSRAPSRVEGREF